jgi:hypothetical protein
MHVVGIFRMIISDSSHDDYAVPAISDVALVHLLREWRYNHGLDGRSLSEGRGVMIEDGPMP